MMIPCQPGVWVFGGCLLTGISGIGVFGISRNEECIWMKAVGENASNNGGMILAIGGLKRYGSVSPSEPLWVRRLCKDE